MYSLDINFIKDRPEDKLDQGTRRSKRRRAASNMTALYLGLGAGTLLPAVVGAGWFYLQNQNGQLEQEVAQLDAQLNSLGIKEQEIQKIQEETNQINAQTQALATVFNQIRPWSATMQDVGDRIPAAVQIETIKQIAPAAPQEGTESPPIAAGGIEISGFARSFNDVNDFVLTLQQSPFFKSTDTKIVTAELTESPVPAAGNAQSATVVPVKPPQIVRYTIQSSLSDVPASELLRELERKGTLGLVNRIRTLQQKGVIQK